MASHLQNDRPLLSPPALVIVDLQNCGFHPQGIFGRIVPIPDSRVAPAISNIKALRTAFHAKGLTVIHAGYAFEPDYSNAGRLFDNIPAQMGEVLKTEKAFIKGTWDAEFIDELKPDPAKGEVVVGKTRHSAFAGGSRLESVLREKGVEHVLVCGAATHVCVESTVRDGTDRDWRCSTIGDACIAPKQEEHEAALHILDYIGGVYTTEQVIQALQEM